MLKFIAGLLLLMIGGALFLGGSVVGGFDSAADCIERDLNDPLPDNPDGTLNFRECDSKLSDNPGAAATVFVGLAIGAGGPLLFWLVLPVWGLFARRRGPSPTQVEGPFAT